MSGDVTASAPAYRPNPLHQPVSRLEFYVVLALVAGYRVGTEALTLAPAIFP